MKYILISLGVITAFILPMAQMKPIDQTGSLYTTYTPLTTLSFNTKPLATLDQVPVVTASVAGTPKVTHADLLKAAGVAESEWGSAEQLIQGESSWNNAAYNASSGACSLVQALPCSKIPGDWKNPVDALTWGNRYVKDRYGTWANAWATWQSRSPHWY